MPSYFRPAITAISGYTPGEQPKPGTPILKLNTNENPYPPAPAALQVLRTLDSEWLRRYPDPYANDFRHAISEALQVPYDWVIVGNGSDDLLNIIIRAVADDHRPVVYPTPTYVLYRTLSQIQTAPPIEIPYPDDDSLPLDALIAANGAITFIASPNSPSGHSVPLADLKQLAANLTGLLVIDEAYVDFAETSALPLLQDFDNIILIRTLSKGYSLAGLRLGFAIAHPTLLQELFKVKDSYNIDAIACAIGTAAMQDQPYKTACAHKVKTSRTHLAQALRSLGFQLRDSQANFLLARPPQGNAEALYLGLKQQGILVRYFNQPRLDDKLRITVGTDLQNQQLIDTLKSIMAH
jgi:histidinol-phosphate aminotransferase